MKIMPNRNQQYNFVAGFGMGQIISFIIVEIQFGMAYRLSLVNVD